MKITLAQANTENEPIPTRRRESIQRMAAAANSAYTKYDGSFNKEQKMTADIQQALALTEESRLERRPISDLISGLEDTRNNPLGQQTNGQKFSSANHQSGKIPHKSLHSVKASERR